MYHSIHFSHFEYKDLKIEKQQQQKKNLVLAPVLTFEKPNVQDLGNN